MFEAVELGLGEGGGGEVVENDDGGGEVGGGVGGEILRLNGFEIGRGVWADPPAFGENGWGEAEGELVVFGPGVGGVQLSGDEGEVLGEKIGEDVGAWRDRAGGGGLKIADFVGSVGNCC